MPPRRSQWMLVRARSLSPPRHRGGDSVLLGLADVRAAVRRALDPPACAGRPALAGAGAGGPSWPGGLDSGTSCATPTETPDHLERDSASPLPPDGETSRAAVSPPGHAEPEPADPAADPVVQRAQSGDAAAFGELYDSYVDLVYRYTYYRVGNRTLAEDLTSETFTRALRGITTFSWQGRDFGAWLVTIARNIIADHYKSARFRMEVSTADLLGAGADRRTPGPEGEVLVSLTNAALLDAVRQLGAEQQECIVLRFLEGLSVHETALAMGKKPGAVKALQYRAVRSLGKLLPSGFEP